MKVYQVRLKVYLLRDIGLYEIQECIAALIDKGFKTDEKLLAFHENNQYKNYCFDLLYPANKSQTYHKGSIYTTTIRTVDESLAKYFSEVCINQFTEDMKGLTAEIRIIPKRFITTLYTLTPVILKNDNGYWRKNMSLAGFEERLKVNLIKKWNNYSGEKLDENFELYTLLEFLNEKPIKMPYKGITLLGDKIRLQVADNDTAQNLAYFSLGTGICEMNSRGAGFVNYRWM